jgi:hypothetical protein
MTRNNSIFVIIYNNNNNNNNNNNDNNSLQFLVYLRAYTSAKRQIIKQA